MTSIWGVLCDAFLVLRRDPWLFAPKLLIALLYSLSMVGTAGLALDALSIVDAGTAAPAHALSLLALSLGVLLFTFLIWLLDVLFNAAYSVALDARFRGKPYHWLSCLAFAAKKSRVVVPAVLASTLLSMLVTAPFVALLAFASVLRDFWLFFLGAALLVAGLLASNFAFFTVYPVSVLEQKRAAHVIRQSVGISKKRAAGVLELSLFSVAVSLAGFLLSFLVSSLAFLLLFALARILVALLATYQILLNPVFYLEYVKRAEAR